MGSGKSLLFLGTSSVDDNASQQKMYFLSKALQTSFDGSEFSFELALHDLPPNRRLVESLNLTGVHWLPWSGAASDVWRKRQLIHQGGWSLVHSIGVGVRILQPIPGRTSKWLRVYDFDEHLSTIRSNGLRKRLYHALVESAMLRSGEAFTCASDSLVQWVRLRRPELKDELLYLPVAISPEEHREDSGIVGTLRNRYHGIDILTYIGTLSALYREQVEEVFALVSRWKKISLEARRTVLVLGGGPDLEYWRDRTHECGLNGLIQFLGFVPRCDLASYLAVSRVLLFPFPPTEQNLGRCPTKAFHYAASGRPLVTNRVGEVARLFGEAAYYYDAGDVAAMSKCVDDALEYGEIQVIPLERLTWESRAKSYFEWLTRLISDRV